MRRTILHALILSRTNVGEADRRLKLFTFEQGLVRVIAKGVRRIPSRRGGHLEPFTRILALVSGFTSSLRPAFAQATLRPRALGRAAAGTHGAGPQELRYQVAVQGPLFLAGVEVLDQYAALRRDPAALQHAAVVSYVLEHTVTEGETAPSLYAAIRDAWAVLPTVKAASQRLLEVALALLALRHAGWAPALAACVRCGVRQPADAVVLDGEAGGWQCLTCHGSLRGSQASLPPRGLKVLRYLAMYPARARHVGVTEEDSEVLVRAWRRYLVQALR